MHNEIYIWDNMEVMKSKDFQKYKNNIKMIYIDPPYNTLSEKSYNDSYESQHWKEFIKNRLSIAQWLLRGDGCIFISIDDNEYANLKIACDEVFSKKNFVWTFITKQAQRSNAKHINTIHEYILCYAKDKAKLNPFVIHRKNIPEEKDMIEKLEKEVYKIFISEWVDVANKKIKKIIANYCKKYDITWLKNYTNVDDKGRIFFAVDLSTPWEPREVNIPQLWLHLDPLPTRWWASNQKFIDLYNENRLSYKNWRPYSKHYLDEAENNVQSILNFFSRQGTNDIKKLWLYNLFDTPKPVELLKFLIKISTDRNDIILDFFAWSWSLAQAVYELNFEEWRDNSYVLIQLDEKVKEGSTVYKACIKYGIEPIVSEILKFRIDTFLRKFWRQSDYLLFNFSKSNVR